MDFQMVSTTNGPMTILMAGATPDNPEPLRCVSTSDGQRTLGVHLAPDGNENREHAYCTIQVCKMGQRIRAAPPGREHIITGFCTIWKAMIQYPLGATCFNSQQCHQIQMKYLLYFLSKIGIDQTTATALRHGPACYGGLEIFNLESEQGIQHASLIVSNLHKADEVGRMLHVSMDHLQLQVVFLGQ
jgi:hypothetical protein